MATPVLAVQALTKDDTIAPRFHARFIHTSGVVLVHTEGFFQRVQCVGVGDGAVFVPHAGGDNRGKGGFPAPRHITLPHKKREDLRFS